MSQVEAGVSGGAKYGDPLVLLPLAKPVAVLGVSTPILHSE
jgi:hypothetical protein